MDIEVMSRKEARKFSFGKHKEQIAVISITDIDKYPEHFFNNSNNGIFRVLSISFNDAELGELNCIADDQSKEIAIFVFNTKNRATKFIVHCEAGVSRSAGVAAAIMKYINNDDFPIFDNSKFCPNMTCYRKVLKDLVELGEFLEGSNNREYLNEKDILEKEQHNIQIWKIANEVE